MSSKKMIINYLVSGERCEVKKTDYLPVSRHSFALLERSTFFLFSSSHRWWGLQKKRWNAKKEIQKTQRLYSPCWAFFWLEFYHRANSDLKLWIAFVSLLRNWRSFQISLSSFLHREPLSSSFPRQMFRPIDCLNDKTFGIERVGESRGTRECAWLTIKFLRKRENYACARCNFIQFNIFTFNCTAICDLWRWCVPANCKHFLSLISQHSDGYLQAIYECVRLLVHLKNF